MQKKLFTELGLSPELLKAIDKIGYEEASPIQSAAIPALLSGRDVIGQSQTGSGKTAAFAIPAIQRVDPNLHAPQVLILCPTRELVVQVAEEVARLASMKKGVRELPIYGGQSYDRQFRGLQQGCQIIIGTPGRVMDHLERGSLKLAALHTIILDEADRMLDMGFIDDIKHILSLTPESRQTVLFSATLPRGIQLLIKTFTKDAELIRIESEALVVPAIEQIYYEVDRRSKLEVLCRLIDLHDVKLGIIFCGTKLMVDDLADHLTNRGYLADRLHGDMSQMMRERVMGKFRKRTIEFLVATDVAARGLDVDDIEIVFNYDLPQDGEDYVHRIGRTGRAGRTGKAITFVAGREIYKMQNIIRNTKSRIQRERIPSIDEVVEKRTNVFFENLKDTLEKGDFIRHDSLVDRLLDQGHSPTDITSALMHLLGNDKTRPTERITEDQPRSGRQNNPIRSGDNDLPHNQPTKPNPQEPRPRPPTQRDLDTPPRQHTHNDDKWEREKPRKFTEAPWERQPKTKKEKKPKTDTWERPERGAPTGPKGRTIDKVGTVSREPGMTRVVMDAGHNRDVTAGEIVGMILGAAKIPKNALGAVLPQEEVTFVDIAEPFVATVIKRINGMKFKGRPISIGIADR